jgi:anaerobic magnesium-protoporphyrin IX monomethyl ester cyclase
MRVLFVEPPKDVWFVMGEYLPPPFGIIQLAAYLEREVEGIEVEVLDCNAERLDWRGLERYMESLEPDIVASSALATCNTYTVARTLETAKRVSPEILTVTGGQHFTATAQESLEAYPEIDVIVRGEGEETLKELVTNAGNPSNLRKVRGISLRQGGRILHNPPRPPIPDLEALPFPGYHLVEGLVHRYHFTAMSGSRAPYALIEGSRGCSHSCTYCTQWRHWNGMWRGKAPRRIAEEMEYCYNRYGSRFIWLTDDNPGSGKRLGEIAEEVLKRRLGEDLMWFTQARCDDIVDGERYLDKLRRSGLRWVLLGVESPEQSTLNGFRKDMKAEDAKRAVELLKENDIAAHTMFIIGHRKDTGASISRLREFVNELDPDLAIFTVLTPFPGSEIYESALRNGWIEDYNWSHYDMVHAIMPTETLSRTQVQEELYMCYRSFYGSWRRRLLGLMAQNELRRRIYRYMWRRGIIEEFKALIKG